MFLLLLLVAPAAAALVPISGKLSRPRYTVIAVAADGRATSVTANTGSFRLRPPARTVSLQLRAPSGTYAGPIVVGREGTRAILGVRAGARLGTVAVRSTHARTTKRLARRWIDTSRQARTKNGVPIGARSIGLVRATSTRSGAAVKDRDLDGVPDTIDIDDDGDLVLDAYDRSRTSRVSSSAVGRPWPGGVWMNLSTALTFALPHQAVNVNGGSTDEQIAAAQRAHGSLDITWIGIDQGSGELDCGTLTYCSAGGTGRYRPTAGSLLAGTTPFPACCDTDNDRLGSLTPSTRPGAVPGEGPPDMHLMSLLPGASSDEIRAGDVLIERGTIAGTPMQSAASVGFVFATFPVVAGYDDGQGDAAELTYPRPTDCPPGVEACPLPVRAGPAGDIVLKLTFWRPQRRRLAGEAGTGRWMDVGNLVYATKVGFPRPGAPTGVCPQSSYASVDPDLSTIAGSPYPQMAPDGTLFADRRGDQPSNRANTFGYTLNLSRCLDALGLPTETQMSIAPLAFSDDGDASNGTPFTNSTTTFRLMP